MANEPVDDPLESYLRKRVFVTALVVAFLMPVGGLILWAMFPRTGAVIVTLGLIMLTGLFTTKFVLDLRMPALVLLAPVFGFGWFLLFWGLYLLTGFM